MTTKPSLLSLGGFGGGMFQEPKAAASTGGSSSDMRSNQADSSPRGAVQSSVVDEIEFDANFALRVAVPSDAATVFWDNNIGSQLSGELRSMSLHGVKFHAQDFSATQIKQIYFRKANRTLNITHSEFVEKQGNSVVFRIHDFAKKAEDWMLWIEQLTRMN